MLPFAQDMSTIQLQLCCYTPYWLQAPSLAITKAADSVAVTAGNLVGFTITVTNAAGAGTAKSVIMTDPLPSATGIVWAIDAANSAAGCSITGTLLKCEWDDLAAGAGGSRTVHVTSTTTVGSAGTLSNTASVSATNVAAPIASTTASITIS